MARIIIRMVGIYQPVAANRREKLAHFALETIPWNPDLSALPHAGNPCA
jgi:hypothetical protein